MKTESSPTTVTHHSRAIFLLHINVPSSIQSGGDARGRDRVQVGRAQVVPGGPSHGRDNMPWIKPGQCQMRVPAHQGQVNPSSRSSNQTRHLPLHQARAGGISHMSNKRTPEHRMDLSHLEIMEEFRHCPRCLLSPGVTQTGWSA